MAASRLPAINACMSSTADSDPRTPSPPHGYSCECHFTREEQIHIVAQFHAHRIRPSRIAYRVGIDIAFIEQLIAGEVEVGRFEALVRHYRKERYQQRLRDSSMRSGAARYDLQQRIEREFRQESDL